MKWWQSIWCVIFCTICGAVAVYGEEYIHDPEYLTLRTELARVANSQFTMLDPNHFEWNIDEDTHRRCVEIADQILDEYPRDVFTVRRRTIAACALDGATESVSGFSLKVAQEPLESVWHFGLYTAMDKIVAERKEKGKYDSDSDLCEDLEKTALPHLERAIELQPDCLLYRIYRFKTWSSSDLEELVRRGLEMIALFPPDLPATEDPVNCFNEEWRFQYRIATNLLHLKRYDEAIDLFDEVIDRFEPAEWNPAYYYHVTFANVFNNLGVCYNKIEEKEKAREAFLKAVELQPGGILALYNLAGGYQCQGQFDKAVQYYRECVQIDPRKKSAWLGLAQCYAELRDPDAAREAIENTLELDPENEPAKKIQEKIRHLSDKQLPEQRE